MEYIFERIDLFGYILVVELLRLFEPGVEPEDPSLTWSRGAGKLYSKLKKSNKGNQRRIRSKQQILPMAETMETGPRGHKDHQPSSDSSSDC